MRLAMRPPKIPPATATTSSSHVLKPMCISFTHEQTKPNNTLSLSEVVRNLEKLMNPNDGHTKLSSSSSSRFDIRPEKLRKRWMEYQGYSDWEGMLDPLDENLRSEILRYGHFVEATYKSFEFDPSSSSYATCKYPKNRLFDGCGLPSTGYKVTKHLRATSGIQLPRWIEKAPSWVATQSSYIGYVAVCDNKEEIKRLGRRDVVIAYRGTTTCLEWLENLRAALTHLPRNSEAMVESGFLSLYTSSTPSCLSLQEMVHQEIRRILQTYGDEPLSLTITGHSLGAALATLTAYDIQTSFDRPPMVTVISFGGPRVGNWSFREKLESQGTKILRIVNSDDVITKVPGFVFDKKEREGNSNNNIFSDDVADNENVNVAGLPSWIQKRAEDAQWVYAEVGKELRLSSRHSPYLRSPNVATCHELNTYLHLVDGFVSSRCPFQATAKRFLRR
ncbi:phospholipase A(1) DAD1, chloroplastic-like [Prosopis cineraria]|uniref:phospholipase A(1) DAD1, chloroplastic-like n=1 Tax=Prosopis cineraria TaxID=364024 RepID=UPI00240F68FD|nr:phospholipase A(1) DAD1, chloroplastic-like [Prosopis cineraria]